MNRTFVVRLARSLTVTLLGAAVVLMGAPVASSDEQKGSASLEKSIVFLQTKWSGFIQVPPGDDPDGQGFWTKKLTYYTTCTGWYASKQAHVVTAGHCVDPDQGREIILKHWLREQHAPNLTDKAMLNWQVEGENKGSPVGRSVTAIQPNGVDGATITSPTTVEVVDFKPTDNGDVALLHVPNLSKETPGMIVAQANPQVGDSVTSIGFPGDLQGIADQSQIAHASFKNGTVSSKQVTPEGVTMLEVSTALAGGMSGGPTVNKDNDVVGVNSRGLTTEANFNFITTTTDLKSFLLSHNVPLLQAAAQPKGTSNTMWYIIIGGVVVVLVLAGGLGLVLLLRRSPRSPQFAPVGGPPFAGFPPQGPAPMPIQPPGSSQPPGNFGGGAPMTGTGATPPEVETQNPLGPYRPPETGASSSPPNWGGERAEAPGGDALTGGPGSAGASKFCPGCGAAQRAEDRFCPSCGRPLS
jgi:serine protease Do